MSKEKNIEEMTDVLKRIFGGSFAYKIEYGKYSGYEGHKEVYTRDIAAELTDKGYLKASDVIDEFVAKLEAEYTTLTAYMGNLPYRVSCVSLAKIRQIANEMKG